VARIFLSYAREDVDSAKRLAEAVAHAGHEVWWDRHLHGGSRFTNEIDRALKDAEVVVVIWTEASVKSAWVQDEAAEGRDTERLVPVSIDGSRAPLGFRQFHTVEFGAWDRDGDSRQLDELLDAIAKIAGSASAATASKSTSAQQSPGMSICVLPFVNMSGDPEQEYFSDGITEDIITDLSQVSALLVIARNTAFTFKGKVMDVKDVARALDVTHVLEGSVRKAGDRVRITAQLIHAATDTHLWAETYDRDLRDILNLQRELARQVSRNIRINVQPADGERFVNDVRVDPKAHDLYLRGRFFWNRRTRSDLLKASEYFQQSIDVDPMYAQAYAGLADSQNELVGFGNIRSADGIPKAKAAALRAIELDERLAEPHTALAYSYAANWEWAEAQKEFQRALDLNPGYVIGLYQYGFILSLMGHPEQAIPLIEQAVASDPLSSIVLYRAGRVYYHARQYDKASELFQRILELNPNDQLGLFGLGLVYRAQGKFDQAIPYLEKQDLEGGFDVAAALAAGGKIAAARRKLAEEMRRHRDTRDYIRPGWAAEAFVSLGEKDESLRWLERGYKERDAWLGLLKVWPPFDPLRSDPRFQDLLRRMNFPP